MKKRQFIKKVGKSVAGIIAGTLLRYDFSQGAGRRSNIKIKKHPQAVARNTKK